VPSFPTMNSHLSPNRSPCFTPHDLPCIPSPNTWRALPPLLRCPPSVTGSLVSSPGLNFTLNPQARRYARPNRVRPPTDCMFASGCFPPRLTATQLPSAIRSGHLLREDFHLSNRTCSQAHGFRLSPERRLSLNQAIYKQTLYSHGFSFLAIAYDMISKYAA
jgi:hypothetical protein